jgi:hypothetical protein
MNKLYKPILTVLLLLVAGCVSPNTPEHRTLSLYGRVVDQHGQPVSNVRVSYIVSYRSLGDQIFNALPKPAPAEPSRSGAADLVQSGPDGRFSIEYEYGYSMRVMRYYTIGRPHYIFPEQEVVVTDKVSLSSPNRGEQIELASTSESHPVTIRAWKVENPEEQIGVFGKSFQDIRIGSAPIQYRFQLGEIQARIIDITSDGPIIELRSTDGGLQPVRDFYGFEAPETGYQSPITFVRTVKRNRFYFRRSDGQGFAMVVLQVGPKPGSQIFGMHFFTYSTKTRSMHLRSD